MNDFQITLRDAVKATGSSQRTIARELGIPLRTLENWLAGTRTPSKITQKAVLETIKEKYQA